LKQPVRFSLWETALIGALLIALTGTLTVSFLRARVGSDESGLFLVRSAEELEPIRAAYGPRHNSRYVEEWIVRDFFQDRRGGVFLDVGANHYKTHSNSFFLETSLGWSGVAIDALPEFGPDYAAHRPRTKFVAMFATDVSDQTVTLFEPEGNKLIASHSRDFTEDKGERGAARQVPTTTLNDVLDQAGIPTVDFLSMDIELAEPKALAGFDIDRFQPALVCIEIHPEVRQQVLDYFAAHQYVLVGKYLRIDPTNAYFKPLGR
jgi:FkbM family methyltransferase